MAQYIITATSKNSGQRVYFAYFDDKGGVVVSKIVTMFFEDKKEAKKVFNRFKNFNAFDDFKIERTELFY